MTATTEAITVKAHQRPEEDFADVDLAADQAAKYRRMLRRLLELEAGPAPRGERNRRSGSLAAARGKTRAVPS